MVDLMTFKSEVAFIVNNLAKAVVAEIFTAAEKVSLNKQNPETEEKLGALVDSLCGEAVEKIVEVVELAAVKQEETGGERRGRPQSEESCEDGGGEHPPTEQTYILVYGSAAIDSRCVLVSVQSGADGDGEGKTSSTEGTGEVMTPHDKHSSPSPPPQADFPDHEYARPSSPPPGAAAAEEGGVCAARSRKQRRGRRKRDTDPTETSETEQCSQCGMLFPNTERLSDHHRKSHPVCSVCGTSFTGILKLREHEIREHGLLPYTCDYCPKRFNHKAHRDLHVKARHTGEKSCHCDICGKGYSCISVLKTHRMTHFDKTFICDVCGKSFYHACHLTRHKLVHQDVRPYQCSTCGKGFTQAANLRSHQAIHTGERQLCSVCGKSYRCLKNHVISKHSHELPADELPARDAIITCEVCGKKFPNPSQFRVHQRSHTGGETVPLRHLREELPSEGAAEGPQVHPHRRETLQLLPLLQNLQPGHQLHEAPQHPHRGDTVQLPRLRETLPPAHLPQGSPADQSSPEADTAEAAGDL
ncbi:zinc finger protein interacting with ribonucleoprotein K [Lates calcarifer]|uniref:Zinc finger protein interacting with ribonucleoprotein K n=1 Tax=Lates calcarifer TaxID=8187 RepID=A0AAJ7PCI9_LATCA|nr:zinc finger protein interacting with ribonucleoprotein K [Lates calcarifer]